MKKRDTPVNSVDIRQQVKTVSVYMEMLFIMEGNTSVSAVTTRQPIEVLSLDISSHFMRVGTILVTIVGIRQLTKVTSLDICVQFMRVGRRRYQCSQCEYQANKKILQLTNCQFMKERSTNAANVDHSLPSKPI